MATKLQTLIRVHRHELARLPHPERPGLTALHYAVHHMRESSKPTQRRVADRLCELFRPAIGLRVAPKRMIHVRLPAAMWARVAAVAASSGCTIAAAVERMTAGLDAASIDIRSVGAGATSKTARVYLSTVDRLGSPGDVRRALAYLATT